MSLSPPRPKPMALNALRAFEAAARLGGFAAAAEELGVTPGAVSAHIKALEDELGASLFDRTARGVAMTPLGARTQPEFTRAFDGLGAAVQALRAEAAPQEVRIAALPALAQFWLSPRLPSLRAAAPEITISITAMEAPPNLKRIPYDLCLFYGDGPVNEIARDWLFPVCAPVLATRLVAPADLDSVPCLSDSTWSGDWGRWAAAAMPGRPFRPRGPVHSLCALAVEETVNGAGVLMGHAALVDGHLRSGALVAPFPQKVPLGQSVKLWSLRPLRIGTAVARVADWLKRSA